MQSVLDAKIGCRLHVAGGHILFFTTPPHATNNKIISAKILFTNKIS